LDYGIDNENKTFFYGLSAVKSTFTPISTRYLALVIDRFDNEYLEGMEIQISFTDGESENHSVVSGRDYNLADTHANGVSASMLALSPAVTADTIAGINENEYGIILSWNTLITLLPAQLFSSYYSTQFFSPSAENLHNIANIIWYLTENEIFGETVYLQNLVNLGGDYYTAVNDIPVKILGVAVTMGGSDGCYITKKLTDALYNAARTYDNTKQSDDILIPYTNPNEIGRLYDLFETDAFARYLKSYSDASWGNYLEIFNSIRTNDPNPYAMADDGSGTLKKYILQINGTSIYPIYSIGQTFGLFNEIFEIIAVVLVIIMIILLWSFMSFTIKTRTKDIEIGRAHV
jgi:hypothetical protein